MKKTAMLLLMGAMLMTGCASSGDKARSLLDRLEFEGDEYGSFELEGTLDLNPWPLINSNVHMKLEKNKDKPGAAAEDPAAATGISSSAP